MTDGDRAAWERMLQDLSVGELDVLIVQAQAARVAKLETARADLRNRFEEEARALGLSLEDILRPGAAKPGVKHGGKGGVPVNRRPDTQAVYEKGLPPDTDERIMRILHASDGRASSRACMFAVWGDKEDHPKSVRAARSYLLRRRLGELVESGVLTVLREASGTGTKAIYGLTEMIEQGQEDAA